MPRSYAHSGNRDFTVSTARWAFQDRGVLKAENLRHRIVGTNSSSSGTGGGAEGYRVLDEVEFLVDIFEYEGDRKMPYK